MLASIGETWGWNGTEWSRLPGGGLSATPIAMVHDTEAKQLVAATALGQLRAYRGTWQSVGPPSGRGVRAMAYDSARQQLLVTEGSTFVGRLGSVQAAAAQPYGSGRAGSRGVPRLGTRGLPYANDRSFGLELVSGRPNAPIAWLFGIGSANVPVGGCRLLVSGSPIAVGGVNNAGGFAELILPISPLPSYYGGVLTTQAVVVDPNGAGLGQFTTTRGLALRVGD